MRRAGSNAQLQVSIAKAIPSLLELATVKHEVVNIPVSIAKAIPSLLEPGRSLFEYAPDSGFNRESDSVTVGALPALH